MTISRNVEFLGSSDEREPFNENRETPQDSERPDSYEQIASCDGELIRRTIASVKGRKGQYDIVFIERQESAEKNWVEFKYPIRRRRPISWLKRVEWKTTARAYARVARFIPRKSEKASLVKQPVYLSIKIQSAKFAHSHVIVASCPYARFRYFSRACGRHSPPVRWLNRTPTC